VTADEGAMKHLLKALLRSNCKRCVEKFTDKNVNHLAEALCSLIVK